MNIYVYMILSVIIVTVLSFVKWVDIRDRKLEEKKREKEKQNSNE
ncbi:hypothetical protein HMPREF1212_02303 [Parabacteroides sp. HGS0025]|jgi:hypothetical protein|uniref:Uncharacterized protein n=1 Tax=Parabacteroides gordonii MS-1 = DSM 23371 TaxID=1203610 RepID=A0A0F5IZI1_9BACT|nr:hypothetical protein HMPREF1536_04123 [Parabacteroides gordonii MS-1 = DSM 23371]KKB51572.1 hypothetical protein HMPREF1212_02303 [Parabacteroides sp. HGS0025]